MTICEFFCPAIRYALGALPGESGERSYDSIDELLASAALKLDIVASLIQDFGLYPDTSIGVIKEGYE